MHALVAAVWVNCCSQIGIAVWHFRLTCFYSLKLSLVEGLDSACCVEADGSLVPHGSHCLIVERPHELSKPACLGGPFFTLRVSDVMQVC